MRGGLERWKRGVDSRGVRQAMAYALQGTCDAHIRSGTGVDALADYGSGEVSRFTVTAGVIAVDALNDEQLRLWVDGLDPFSGERRGRDLASPNADLILDGTVNAPKSYSIASLIHPELAREFEALQDRLRERIITTWQRELNARRGAGGSIRESLHRIEVVELQHRRSRALDPHIHRHLWLNVKVLGEDGKWSNVDSRVAMKMHTVINAEGELAARADPEWILALARHGYSLDAAGEIAELAHAVRPLSRRSNQIEANRAQLIASWRAEHRGDEPDRDVVRGIDRLAWATGRPNKPGEVDELAWEQMIRDEMHGIDPTLLVSREPLAYTRTDLADVDRDLLAARAIVDADRRSAGSGGRFSVFDIRAGAIRALAATGIVEDRSLLQGIIDDVVERAHAHTLDLLAGDDNRPDHIKGFMSTATATLKADLAARFDSLAEPGERLADATIGSIARDVLPPDTALDDGQREAAAALAGTDRLVAIVGPAGAGKTTMLRVARTALMRQGRQMLVVAPTKKAASVASREIGTAAASVHALLADHGWRWSHDDAGLEVWSRLRTGEVDPKTSRVYGGPRRFSIGAGDRIVVDEAGMVDLHTANALAVVAAETGASLAMVGDPLQAKPVGHSGAMGCLTRRATAVVELTAVHRFNDPSFAALTLRLREPATKEDALEVAAQLDERGLIHRVTDAVHAREVMVESYFRWSRAHARVALVTSTNEEADAMNEAIQARRLELGQLILDRVAVGMGEQRLLEGDVVQTRRNDRGAGVENRAIWKLRRIRPDAVELVSLSDAGDVRTVRHDYVAEHVHLAYAATVHGIQGETTDASVVGPGVDASGLYVGMTRGRSHNEVLAIARTDAVARDAVAESMLRGTPEVSIDDSIRAARVELGRAARWPVAPGVPGEPVPATAWNDRARRPYGAIVDVAAGLARARDEFAERRAAADRLSDWSVAVRRTLLEREVLVAAGAALSHGRTVAIFDPDQGSSDTYQALSGKLVAREQDAARLEQECQTLSHRIDELEAESVLRAGLSHAERRTEETARAAHRHDFATLPATSSKGFGLS
jgi:exodeoxyribonuclease V alpha subunit